MTTELSKGAQAIYDYLVGMREGTTPPADWMGESPYVGELDDSGTLMIDGIVNLEAMAAAAISASKEGS